MPITAAAPRALLLASSLLALGTGVAHAAGNPCDPRSYGALNDGTTDNTAAIQAAIDACAAAGGGIVPITGGGTYITGPIALKSHILLQIMAPTVLKNTTDHSRYQPAFIGYPFEFKNNPAVTGIGPNLPGLPEAMISAANVTDVGIIGNGTIDGSGADPAPVTPDNPKGLSYWQLAAIAKAAGLPYPAFPDIPTSNGLPRPWLVEFYNDARVTVNGILLTNSPMWNLALRYDTAVTVSGLRVFNDANDVTGAPNTDGIDPVGSNGVTLSNLDINTGDDNIAMKSGLPGIDPANPGIPTFQFYKPPYNLPRVPLANITISNSVFRRGHGMSVGSETVNGINHIRANNIQFLGSDNGFRIKTGRDRGNQITDMVIQNLKMTDVGVPISISTYYPTIPAYNAPDIVQPHVPSTQPFVHNITILNVTATNPKTVRNQNTTGGLIIGLPESPVYDIGLGNISITSAAPGGTYMRLRNVSNLTCSGVAITPLHAGAPNEGHTFDNEGGLTGITGCDVGPVEAP